MSDNTYNGWSNYETWQAALWLNEMDFLGRCEEDRVNEVHNEILEYELYELAGVEGMTAFAKDIYNIWLSCVNFNEITENFNSDLGGA